MVRKNNNGFIGLNGFAGCVESVAILRIQNPHIPCDPYFTNRNLIHAQRGIMRHAATSNR